ncbi:type IV pilus modification PilV family protein [Microlunatus soli]|uniref:Cell division protein FtsL n=1 Tax=Microlunatus soli TaxID=630515 RepID=A0A1H1PG15_9ACTN|nr:hypothetical protein [Microlunatus soli]SDS10084.1 hypothetical protein SAMN04489812_0884 [Microlunatus soli]
MSALWADDSRRFGLRSPGSGRARKATRRSPGQEPRKSSGSGASSRVAAPARLGRVPFVLVLIAVFGIGMAGLLALNTTLQGQAFQAGRLHQQANQLTYQQASLERRVEELRSIDNLAARAFGMGMRPNPRPGFVEVPSGKVDYKPKPVTGDEVPGLVKTPEQIQAEQEAAEAKKQAAKAKKQADAARREAERAEKKQAGNQAAGASENKTKRTDGRG